jgi:hypothetical protein
MRSPVINLVFLLIFLLPKYKSKASILSLSKQNVAQDFLEKTLLQLIYQKRLFLDGFSNGTTPLEKNYEFYNIPILESAG